METLCDTSSALVIGAGSIGAHLSRSLAKAGWVVTVVDNSESALRRFEDELYPKRYGELSENISLALAKEIDTGLSFDALVIGTPPDTHMAVLQEHEHRAKRIVSIQKPLTTYRKTEIRALEQFEAQSRAIYLTGFNHRVSLGALSFWALLPGLFSKQRVDIEVTWLESWDGIMQAHPWLSSPSETYLGFTSRGGGALFEHSHGLDLGLLSGTLLGLGPMTSLSADVVLENDGLVHYDKECSISAEFANGSTLSSRQDVTTWPPKKKLRISSSAWTATLEVGSPERVIVQSADGGVEFVTSYSKSREEDFDAEVRQFKLLGKELSPMASPTSFSHGLLTSKISSFVVNDSFKLDRDVFTREDLVKEGILNEKAL